MTNPRDARGPDAHDPEVDAEVIADLDDHAADLIHGGGTYQSLCTQDVSGC
jgi:hypothetical protein